MTFLRNAIVLGALALNRLSVNDFRREEGQTLAEYALILALIAIGVLTAVFFLRDQISGMFNKVGSQI
jgi:Flp pilus assembly pilin Flp